MGPQVRYIPNGVDVQHFHRPADPIQRTNLQTALRGEFEWPQGEMGFLFTGRFARTKNLPFFLDAWAKAVKETGIPAFIAFVGAGEEEDLIKKTAERHGIQDRVFIRAGNDDVARLLRAAD